MTFEQTDWDCTLEKFRSFGGVAENIVQRRGEFGAGLFPIDTGKPVRLLVPNHLLVQANDVNIVDGKLVISKTANYHDDYKYWFKEYQANYSWGAEGRHSVQQLIIGIESLHSDVKSILNVAGLYQPKKDSDPCQEEQMFLNRFLASRCIKRGKILYIMPLVELVNHSPQAQNWLSKEGKIGMSGFYSGEVLVNYSHSDSLRRLFHYGFISDECMAFSLNITVRHNDRIVSVIGGGGRRWFEPPSIEKQAKNLSIKQPLLGSRKHPRLARFLFQEATKEMAGINGQELFDQICNKNVQTLIKIIKSLDKRPSNMGEQIVQACLNQLNILSYRFGTRSSV